MTGAIFSQGTGGIIGDLRTGFLYTPATDIASGKGLGTAAEAYATAGQYPVPKQKTAQAAAAAPSSSGPFTFGAPAGTLAGNAATANAPANPAGRSLLG